MKVFRDWTFFQGIILVPSLTWDKSSDTELGSFASREQDFFKFAKCMHHKCWIHIKLLDFINVNVNEYKFMKKKHLATSFRTKKNEIHSISPLTNQCILKREMLMFFFFGVPNVKIIFQNSQVSHIKNLENSKFRKFSKRLLKCVVHVQ